MIRSILLLALSLTLLLPGCSPAFIEEPVDADPPVLGHEWIVKMTQSGGIMGLMRSVEVSSDGGYIISDERLNKSVAGKLAETELKGLQGIIEDSKHTAGNQRSPCADCFNYEIMIQSDGRTLTAQLDDITLPDSGMEALVAFLRGLMDANLR